MFLIVLKVLAVLAILQFIDSLFCIWLDSRPIKKREPKQRKPKTSKFTKINSYFVPTQRSNGDEWNQL